MTDTPDMFEGRLVGYSKQSRKDGDWIEVRFHIHPDDVTPALAAAPLKTIFMVAAVPAQKNKPEQPEKRQWDERQLSEQVAIRCADPYFQSWLAASWSMPLSGTPEQRKQLTEDRVKMHVQVISKKEITHESEPGRIWLGLDQEYQDAMGLVAEKRS